MPQPSTYSPEMAAYPLRGHFSWSDRFIEPFMTDLVERMMPDSWWVPFRRMAPPVLDPSTPDRAERPSSRVRGRRESSGSRGLVRAGFAGQAEKYDVCPRNVVGKGRSG